MTTSDIREFKGYVKRVLVRDYHMTKFAAHRAVVNSYLSKVLKNDKNYADHESVEEWAEIVYCELQNKRMMKK